MGPGFKKAAVAAARAAWDKKAEAVLLLNVKDSSPLADYLLLATALSPAHMESLEQEIKKAMKIFRLACLHQARPQSDNWRVLDFGGLIIHLLSEEARLFYSLEKLHPQAPRVHWMPLKRPAPAAP